MKDCIFCKIIKKEIPALIIYEDDSVVSFLDVNPVSNGHTLVIPKKHSEDIFSVSEKDLEKISQACKKLAIILKEKLKADGINILNASGKEAQQSVFHLHFHVIPRHKKDSLDLWFHGKSEKLEKVEKIYKKITKQK